MCCLAAFGILLGISLMESLTLLQRGFGQIIEKIGLLILFGTVIGVSMERSGATLAIAQGILHSLTKLPLPYALSCIGYLVSIPVFCDAAFVILSHINKTLSQQTKTPLIGLTVALSTGLFAPHVLCPQRQAFGCCKLGIRKFNSTHCLWRSRLL